MKSTKRDKHAPMEISSKRPTTRKRTIITNNIPKRDPRFDPLSTLPLNPDLFKQSYSFIQDLQSDELSSLKKQLQNTPTDDILHQRLTNTIQSISSRQQTISIQDNKNSLRKNWLKQELARVKQGKKPYYLKESDYKKLELVDKYKKLSSSSSDPSNSNANANNSSALEKYLEKRRKKNSQKERKSLPFKKRI